MIERERWQQISQIFEGALVLSPEERLSYIEEHCGGDDSLRREVQLLIEAHQKADEASFIGSPAAEHAAPYLASDEDEEVVADRLQKGEQIGHYIVSQKIGAGGMGEVYLAKDTRLDRTVALKILPADVASDQRRMMRFKQEARIVSSLNQPNILTIYEFGETDSHHFIATEYIDGETLRRQMKAGQLKLPEILDIAIQVAAALDAAHEAKIVHRDIKPENIMIRRRDRVVKVLDFGLAKLSEKPLAPGQSTDTEAATAVLLKTLPGSVMGTFNYMSPEQAQGMHVDERTDTWSLAVVLYEMLAGRTPFSGPTSSHTVVSILEKEPEVLSRSAKIAVPAELERIITKALAKNRDERYQTARDLLIDLKSLKRRLEVAAEVERSNPSGETAANEAVAVTKPSLETENEILGPASGKRRWLLLLFALAASVGVVAFALNAWRSSRPTVLPSPPAPVAVSERRVSYWMSVQRYRDGKPYKEEFRLPGEIYFQPDDHVRLHLSSAQTGYLYILNEPPSGEQLSILFPSPTTNRGSALLESNHAVQIPEESWFSFSDEQGAEKLWLIWSATSVPELEAVRSFANEKEKGIISSAALNRSALDFIRLNSRNKPNIQKNEAANVTELNIDGNLLLHSISLQVR